jgi:hypothetical protein
MLEIVKNTVKKIALGATAPRPPFILVFQAFFALLKQF